MNELLTCVVGFFAIPLFIVSADYLPRATGVVVFAALAYLSWLAALQGRVIAPIALLGVGAWFGALQFRLHRRFSPPVRTTTEP